MCHDCDDVHWIKALSDRLIRQLPIEARAVWLNELKDLRANPPSVCADCKPIDYIPPVLSDCQQKLKRVLKRLEWSRTINFLQEMVISDNRQQSKEIETLHQDIESLNKQLERSHQQLRSLLGVDTAKSKPEDPAEDGENGKTPVKRKKRGAPKGHRGKTRPIPEHVDLIKMVPPPGQCDHCGASQIKRSARVIHKYIEDIPEIIKTITDIQYQEGQCECCGHTVIDPAAKRGPPVMIGHQLKATLTLLRHQAGMSYRKLSLFCHEVCRIPLSPSGVLGIINRASQQLTPAYHAIESALPKQAVLHADETGWRMDGERWYLWNFCNRRLIYFHADATRSGKVPKSVLGESFSGLLHSDFYAVYDQFPNTQKCLVHYLRDIKNELKVSPEDKALWQLRKQLKQLITLGKKVQRLKRKGAIKKGKQTLDQLIKKITRLKSDNDKTQTLINRAIKYQDSLARFVNHPQAEFHNNWAEQTIRFAVIFRKLSFGHRTEQGAGLFCVLTSVLDTCRLNGINTFEFLNAVFVCNPENQHELLKNTFAPILALPEQ